MWPLATTGQEGVPVLFHEPNVVTGFRPINQPWIAYFLSAFQLHNELLNVWTHLVALVMVLVCGGQFSREFDLLSDPYMWPLAVGIITMVVLYLCSSFAHLLQNRSELAHYTCFMCDYAGIGLYGFGSTMVHYWYCLHEDLLGSLSHQLAIPVGAVLAVVVCTCCSISKTKYQRPYPFARRLWQMSSVLAIYVWLIFPIWYRIWLYVHDGKWESSFTHHLKQMLWFTTGGFFFGSDIPQRLFAAGTFDLVGHSHQLFHVCIMMTTYEQLNALYLELTDGISIVHNMAAPTLFETWGMLGCVLVANSFVVYFFHFSVRRCLGQDGRNKKEEKQGEKDKCKGHGGGSVGNGRCIDGAPWQMSQRGPSGGRSVGERSDEGPVHTSNGNMAATNGSGGS
ncbi:membrane progestin receptor beta [Aplysia californica]|uniref:Membrane progestin receptor beta n=1 Tax=Aplysia californica TaxID=6500 RepID=A0ABM0K2P6_APLCA|nr:membrane progestin receptor beta [Aplysia californica]